MQISWNQCSEPAGQQRRLNCILLNVWVKHEYFSTMYFILMKFYLVLENPLLLYVPFVNCTAKLWCTFLAVVIELFHCTFKKNYFFSEYIQLTVVSTDCHFRSKGNDKSFLIQNMILMLFKLYVYKSKVSGTLNFHVLLPSATGQS